MIENIDKILSNYDMKSTNVYLNQSNETNELGRFKVDTLESDSRINFLTFRLISLINRKKQENLSSRIYNELKNFYKHHILVENFQHSNQETDLNSHVTTMSKQNAIFLASSKAPSFNQKSMSNDIDYRTNELYSIFVSILTAAIFVTFIMWRWFKMKSDLRKALQEQNLIDQQHRLNNFSSRQSSPTTPASTSTNVSPASLLNNHFFSSINYHENVDTTLSQCNERPNRQNKQVLEAAKHCLHQLKNQTRTALNSRSQCSHNTIRSSLNSRTIPVQIQPLIENLHSSSIRNLINLNEDPPSYDSLMKKSSSLPSYCQLVSKKN